jgi:putative peptidoglycan lipid II flippase
VSDQPDPPGLLRSNVVVALGTATSRITGLLRVGALAYALGLTVLADSYNLANTTPNIIYELLLGGVLSAALVPLFTKHLEERDDEATSAVISVAVIILAAITAFAVIAAPIIVRLYLGSGAPTEKTTVDLARFILPEIFFYGLMALFSAMLNARRRFFAPAWSPVLNNVIVIAVVLLVAHILRDGHDGFFGFSDHDAVLLLLGIGSTLGIAVMSLSLWPALRHAGVRLRFRPQFRHPSVRRLLGLSGWTIGYVIANQVALLVVYRLASGLPAGSLSTYVYAFTFFQLPHGLLAVSIMTTFGPELARAHLRRDRRGFQSQASLGLRMTVALVLPAAAAYIVLGRPFVALALQRGGLREAGATEVADALSAFAWGLAGFSAYLFILRCFYARGDARTPFIVNVAENIINIVLALVLVHRYDVRGLSWAYALAYLVAAALAFAVLESRVPGFDVRGIVVALARLVLAAVTAGLAAAWVAQHVGGDHGFDAVVRAVVGGLVLAAVYVAVLLYLRAPEVEAVRARIRRRQRRAADVDWHDPAAAADPFLESRSIDPP